MSIDKLRKRLQNKTIDPVYLLCGEEPALVYKALELIQEHILIDSADPCFALTSLDGRSSKANDIEAAARTGSLFGGRRLVVLRDAHLLHATQQKKLAPYLKKPVQSTTLILVVRGAGLASRNPKLSSISKAAKAYAKAIGNKSCVFDFQRPKTRELPSLTAKLLAEKNLVADKDALFALVDAVGEDLGGLIQAAEKLSLYLHGTDQVTTADIASVVVDTRSQSVFELTDAVAQGNELEALCGVRRLLRDGESPLSILGHLARHFRNLTRVSALSSRGQRAETIQSSLGLHPFVIKKTLSQSRRFSQPELVHRMALLSGYDRKLKGGVLPDSLDLEILIHRLCEKPNR